MTTLSHIAVGILVTHYFVGKQWLPDHTVSPYIFGVVFANIPDIDGIVALTRKSHTLSRRHIWRLYAHHNELGNLSHYPSTWVGVFLFVAALSLVLGVNNIAMYILFGSINVLCHFLMDTCSMYEGIAWLGPWKKKKYSFIGMLPILPANTREWVQWYVRHWVMYLEIAIWILTLFVLFD